ncbi:MAG TPA: hypothetical protein VE089_10930 [Nitrososphaeraceae archaeon]|nr:hypothetical protein [Nitrososphaeraceae archaeon]
MMENRYDYNLIMNKTEKFECDDRYEAEKLAGLLNTLQTYNSTTHINGVAAIIKNEIIITLSDRSNHSVTLKHDNDAIRLKSFIEFILNRNIRISGDRIEDCMVEVVINE